MLARSGFELTTSGTVVRHLNQLSQPLGGKKTQRQHEDDSKIKKISLLSDLETKWTFQETSDCWCTGHKAGKWCCRSSRWCCSFCTFGIGFFWNKERLLGWLITWWLCWRSSRLDSTYRKDSIRTSLCPKTGLSALKTLSCFRLSDASCGSCLTLLQGIQDTGT